VSSFGAFSFWRRDAQKIGKIGRMELVRRAKQGERAANNRAKRAAARRHHLVTPCRNKMSRQESRR
jgi:hypothetical protein